MFGLELWFVLAILSAISGGLFIFTTKVAAERDYDVVLLGTAAIFMSSFVFLGLAWGLGDTPRLGLFVWGMVLVNGVAYFIVNVLRHFSLQAIDTAIYYPIYKTLTPIFAIGIAILLFCEKFSGLEWLGLLLSLAVPVLLITNAEKYRQKNLVHGLRLLGIAAVASAIAVAGVKAALTEVSNPWWFIFWSDLAVGVVGLGWMLIRNGKRPLRQRFESFADRPFLALLGWMSLTSAVSYASLLLALDIGSLGIVYTIQSLYILIPIILSIIYYHEHWNARKVIAIILSIAALAFLK